jgi:hypothetical protein
MRIISTFLPQEPSELTGDRPTIMAAFDTLVDNKSVVVGLTVGSLNGPHIHEVRVSAVGQAVIDRCARHIGRNYPNAPVLVAGVAQVAGAVKRVRQVLQSAAPQSLVLLVCRDGKVYDAAFDALHIDLQSARQDAH